VGLGLSLLLVGEAASQPNPVQPGGGFGFPYPSFTGAPGVLTAQRYVQTFNAAYHNPNAYAHWLSVGTDIRVLNPNGMYLKHINLRTVYLGRDDLNAAEGHPNAAWIQANHPEWIVKSSNGSSVPIFRPDLGEAVLDFGNDAYLDWALNTWMPQQYLDATDRDPNRLTWHVHDNGNFDAMRITCRPGDAVCTRYTTDEGVRTAWENLLRRFRARYPNKRLVISTGPVTYKPVAEQMALFQRILSLSGGYFCESLTNTFAYWDSQPNDAKRIALVTTMQLASWLADTNKVFFPNYGMTAATEPTQAQTDYGWAFFNLMRKGSMQFFSKLTKDASGNWAPRTYPEMNVSLGQPTEVATQQSANVWRRTFTNAIAYVNLSDAAVSIPLPSTGGPYKNSRGNTVDSPLTLGSFSGLTVYKGDDGVPAMPTNVRVQ
jgi:hypothetical protein